MITAKAQSSRRTRHLWVTLGLLLTALQYYLFPGPIAQAQTFTVLHRFRGNGDGRYPSAGLIQDSSGNLYGTTAGGGSFDRGTVFEIEADGREVILHNFWGGDGQAPLGSLIRDKSGNFYGTTRVGSKGSEGNGTVFKLSPALQETVLYSFTGGTDGGWPSAGLIRDATGNLYGTTTDGGDYACDPAYAGCGVVFKLDEKGKETVLYAFTKYPDGSQPEGLVRDRTGNLYGATLWGGTYNRGTVFKIDPSGKETQLYTFTGGKDGGWPSGSLLRDSSGNLYGVAIGGGDLTSCGDGCGVVFKVDRAGKETVLYAFKGNTDGLGPLQGLATDGRGNFYGVTEYGGSTGCGGSGCGVIFKVDAGGKETILHRFAGGEDGHDPDGPLTIDNSGNLYGATSYGGDSTCDSYPKGTGCGLVFKLTP